jgi:hypothetical protein
MKTTTVRNVALLGFVLAMPSLAGSGKVGGLVPFCPHKPVLNGKVQPRPVGSPFDHH